jgi:glycosyltransferase involved in cell wall biosynthesis
MFPEAPIYTILYDKEKMREKFSGKTIRASFLQKAPRFMRKRYKYLLPFMPVAPETFDLRDFDLVVSSSGAWSKGIITRLNTVHVSYIHSPMRFVWDANEEYLSQQGKKKIVGFFARFFLNYIRTWDKAASDRPDFLAANSRYTQARIKKYYRRDSIVIYPPVVSGRSENGLVSKAGAETSSGKYFLIVSRLSPYKKIDKAIEAFNKLDLPLIIAGEGQQMKYLKHIANKNIRFLGWQDEEKLKKLYAGARAFVFPGVDDFGIAPVEAMSYGIPVLAIKKGGITEVMEEGKTGEFFESTTPEIIADSVRRFLDKEKEYDRGYIRKRAEEFSKERFSKEFGSFIEKSMGGNFQ